MTGRTIIVIGSSTGGIQALPRLISRLAPIDASVLIVQHMPKYINESVTKMLGGISRMTVKLADNGDLLQRDSVYVAPSDIHMQVQDNRRIVLIDGEKVNYVRPAIDTTMKSIQRMPKVNVIGVVLTGMGSDGAAGIKHIKSLGGITFAQDRASCTIYGMPKVAFETGMIDFILTPEEIGDKINELMEELVPVA